jgi:mannose/fructose/N-acetylgalactosamine-specific phosphotransferase system component IIC
MTAWLAVGLLGGVVGLDATSFPQMMVSRPVVAGTLAGALLGRPVEGALIGFIMEAFALVILPIGAARYPESGTATVGAVAAYAAAGEPVMAAGPLAVLIAFALCWEWVAGETVVLQRRTNGRFLTRSGAVSPTQLERRHLAAMSLDLLRGGVLAVSGGLLGYGLLELIGTRWAIPADVTFSLLAVLAAIMVASTIPFFGGARERRWALGLGLVAGTVLTLLR